MFTVLLHVKILLSLRVHVLLVEKRVKEMNYLERKFLFQNWENRSYVLYSFFDDLKTILIPFFSHFSHSYQLKQITDLVLKTIIKIFYLGVYNDSIQICTRARFVDLVMHARFTSSIPIIIIDDRGGYVFVFPFN